MVLSEVLVGAVAGDGTLIRKSDGGLGVHHIPETEEAFSMRILREQSGRWKAALAGPSFHITESFAGESEAEQHVRKLVSAGFSHPRLRFELRSGCETRGESLCREVGLQATTLGVGTIPAPAAARSVREDGDAGDLLGGASVSGAVLFLVDSKGEMQGRVWQGACRGCGGSRRRPLH